MIILQQNEKTEGMNLSISEEASLILQDIFEDDSDAAKKALSSHGIETDEQVLDNEDLLYSNYLPIREDNTKEQ